MWPDSAEMAVVRFSRDGCGQIRRKGCGQIWRNGLYLDSAERDVARFGGAGYVQIQRRELRPDLVEWVMFRFSGDGCGQI